MMMTSPISRRLQFFPEWSKVKQNMGVQLVTALPTKSSFLIRFNQMIPFKVCDHDHVSFQSLIFSFNFCRSCTQISRLGKFVVGYIEIQYTYDCNRWNRYAEQIACIRQTHFSYDQPLRFQSNQIQICQVPPQQVDQEAAYPTSTVLTTRSS